MNQNEKQPERTAMDELIKFIDSDPVLMVCGNVHYVRMKAIELRDTVEKEQWIAAYIEGLRDCQTGYTNQYTSTDHDLNKIRDFAESRFNQKYGTDGK